MSYKGEGLTILMKTQIPLSPTYYDFKNVGRCLDIMMCKSLNISKILPSGHYCLMFGISALHETVDSTKCVVAKEKLN